MAESSTIVGKAVYQFDLDLKNLKLKITKAEETLKNGLGSGGDKAGKEAGEKASKGFGDKFKDGLKNFGTGVAASITGAIGTKLVNGIQSIFTGAKNTFTSAISEFGDYQQLVGGVETLFKESSNIVQNYANNAYKTAGLSANQYMETVTGFSASLLQSVGGDTEKAAKIADMAITDMADNANKMGTSMESIQYAYQGFAKQNYTMLDNLKLGYGGTKEEMQRLLEDAEKISGIHYDISNLDDVYNAIHVIQGELGITGTTAKEAGETLQGSAASMKAAWKNLMTGMADGTQNTSQLIDNFIESAKTYGKNLLPVVKQALQGFSQLIKEMAPIIAEELPKLVEEVLPGLVEGATAILSALIEILPSLLESLGKAVLAALPSLWAAMKDIIPQFLELIGKALQEPAVWGVIGGYVGLRFGKSIVSGLKNKAGGLIKTGAQSLMSKAFGGSTMDKVGDEAAKSTVSIGTKISEAIKGIGEPIKTAFQVLGEILQSVATAVMEPLKIVFKGVGEAIAGFFTALANPQIAVGAAMLAVAAASIAASIFLIGTAIGAVMPVIQALFDNILMPLANFIRDTVLILIDALVTALGNLTNTVLIPLGEFLVGSFLAAVQTITDAITKITQEAIIPLIDVLQNSFIGIINSVKDAIIDVTQRAIIPLVNTLSGAFANVIRVISDLLNGLMSNAFNGIKNIIDAVGRGFESLGNAINTALGGVQGVISAVADLIARMASAAVAMVALVRNKSINYGPGYANVRSAFAEGGRVFGPGTATSDSIPALLSNGEYVINAGAARDIGYDTLDALNSGRGGNSPVFNFSFNGVVGTKSEMRKLAMEFHDAYEEVERSRMRR